jgi:histidinol-phosphate aminotransferase
VNQIAVECVLEAIRCKKDVLRYAREVKKARVVMSKGLGRLGIEYYPSHANFILVRFGNRAKEVLERLGRLGILVRDRNYELPGCLRVGVGTIAQTEFFLKKLEQIWKNS